MKSPVKKLKFKSDENSNSNDYQKHKIVQKVLFREKFTCDREQHFCKFYEFDENDWKIINKLLK